MFNIKTFALAALTAAAGFTFAPSAEAATCLRHGPGQLCNSYSHSNRYGQVYNVGYSNGVEKFGAVVVCDGRNLVAWEGKKQNMTEGQVRWAVTEFCALPNG